MWTHFIIAQVFHKVKCFPTSLDDKYKWLLARMLAQLIARMLARVAVYSVNDTRALIGLCLFVASHWD